MHDREDAAGAQSFVDGVSKTAYPENSTEVEIDGATAYFGTNGQRYATIVYTDGRYVFEVILTAAGMPPGELLIEAEDAAKAFPGAY